MSMMREMYESACRPEPAPPNSSLGMVGGDPFYDRNPWFRLIGRYILYSRETTCEYNTNGSHVQYSMHNLLMYTVEPLYKDTPEMRTPV